MSLVMLSYLIIISIEFISVISLLLLSYEDFRVVGVIGQFTPFLDSAHGASSTSLST